MVELAAVEDAGLGALHRRAQQTVLLSGEDASPVQVAAAELELVDAGISPYDAVTRLVRDAQQAADGALPDPAAFRQQLDEAEEIIAEYGSEDPQPGEEPFSLRLTPLDVKRPARDLTEDLLYGIHGCWLLHEEYAEPLDDEDGDADDEEKWDDEKAERNQQHSRERFADHVRSIAAENRDRLV